MITEEYIMQVAKSNDCNTYRKQVINNITYYSFLYIQNGLILPFGFPLIGKQVGEKIEMLSYEETVALFPELAER